MLNFNEIKRPELKIELNDPEKTQITLVSPIKSKANEFIEIFTNIVNMDPKMVSLDQTYKCCADLLSTNKEEIEITKEKLEEIFTLEDLIILLREYYKFLMGIKEQKN